MSDNFYVLAIDPSLNSTGYSCAKLTQQRNGYKVELVEVSYIPNGHFETADFGRKLRHIESRLYQLRDIYKPSVVVKEDLAVNSIAQSERLAPVHAIIHMVFGDNIIGYSPTKIKKDITGDGKSDKSQIQQSLRKWVGDMCWFNDDMSDSVAILYTWLLDAGYVSL